MEWEKGAIFFCHAMTINSFLGTDTGLKLLLSMSILFLIVHVAGVAFKHGRQKIMSFSFLSPATRSCRNSRHFVNCFVEVSGRCGGLVVSTLHSGSRGPGLSPGRAIVLCSWAKLFTLTVPLSIQEYKWVQAICQGNLTKCWGILLLTSCYRNPDKLQQ